MYENILTILSLLLVIGVFVWLGFLYRRVGRNYRKRKKDYRLKNPTNNSYEDYSWKHTLATSRKQILLIWLVIIWSIFIVAIISSFVPENTTREDAFRWTILILTIIWKIIKRPLFIWLIGFRIYWLITKPKENLPYLIIAIVVGVISYFFSNTNNWTWFYYPNAIVTTDNLVVQQWFRNKSACFDRIDTMIKWNDKEDYECGTNCRYEASFELWRCKDTYDSR